MSLEKLLFENSCIKSKACMAIYKKSCRTVQECFEGLISHPAMIILTLFFNVDTWPSETQKKLNEARKINSIGNLFISALAKDWENCDVEKAKAMINDVNTQFALMNEIFPCPRMEMRLELNRLLYVDTREMLTTWLNQQCQTVGMVNTQIRPANVDQFIENSKVGRSTGNNLSLLDTFKDCGKLFRARAHRVFKHQVGYLSLTPNDQDVEYVIKMSMTLNVLKIFSIITMEGQVKYMCGKFLNHVYKNSS